MTIEKRELAGVLMKVQSKANFEQNAWVLAEMRRNKRRFTYIVDQVTNLL
jgi:hypothetical protein